MSISRRHFLRAGGVAMAAVSAPVSLSALAAERRPGHAGPSGQPVLMSKAMFAAHLNTVFLIRPDGGREIPVDLIQLRDCGSAAQQKAAARAGQECFALTFRPRDRQALKQNTYRLEHRALGRFELFVAPVKSNKYGPVYEAIINHVRP
jgi:Domain of unknown function (DUF6916)/TAT (twin-arginine translocation) pathway signal sequence